ncbi:hypothetical protein PPYR_08847 [Photinus pyralis]|uniref:Protein commissureless n=3 Tax=Photinus pyralis TaxID=7054 RepID=A0A5N4AKM2_PHOPY|nr:hypothetical protein PPYR_08847 [Photinus pyralis]
MEKYFFNKIDNIHPFEEKNFSVLLSTEVDKVIAAQTDPDYEQFLADVWVGIILTLIVLSCVCCMCSCLLYHKFQQWKRHILQARNANVENGNGELESLPSYTIVSGLPSYAEALEQLKKVKEQSAPRIDGAGPWTPHTPPTPSPMSRLSVAELFQIYKTPNLNLAVKN